MIFQCCQRMLLIGLLLISLVVPSGWALQPDEIYVLANRQVPEGVELARYYARRRGIPSAHLILLDVPFRETCSRSDYDRRIADPVRRRLAAVTPAWRIRCLVTMYGMPLRIAAAEGGDSAVRRTLEAREAELKSMLANKPAGAGARVPSDDLAAELDTVRKRLNAEKVKVDSVAAVDSELCVVRIPDAPVGGWIENPYCVAFRGRTPTVPRDAVIMTARLDGPEPAAVRRMIDDAIQVEARGLTGTAYFDARWPADSDASVSAYRVYDRAIHRAARGVEAAGRMPVVVDARSSLFQPGQCPHAALYCGWYSLKKYVPAFRWQPGSVGYHIASGECTTLRNKGAQVWCKRMIEEGIGATIGPVGEPYVQAFPLPDLFFGFLTEGVLSLGECYMISLPYISWKMVLLGDPLYHPF